FPGAPMANRNPTDYQHPLDRFLSRNADSTMLDYLADEYAGEPFEVAAYREELTRKLKENSYPRKVDNPDHRKTFYEILKKAELLDELLSEGTLREFWKSHQLEKILKKKEELTSTHSSVYGLTLTEHRRKVRAVQQDLN